MKIQDGTLKNSSENRYGNFEVGNGGDDSNVKSCLYKRGTFFSWITHCVRFKFSREYREDVKENRRQILIELLGKNQPEVQEQEVSDSCTPLSRDEERELSRRSQFNARVSGLLKSRDGLMNRAASRNVPLWQRDMAQFNDLRSSAVLRHGVRNSARTVKGHHTPSVYLIGKVEASVHGQYVLHSPDVLGPDMDGELGKRFLTYYTFTGQAQGALNQKMFDWQPVNAAQFSAAKAYPAISSRNLYTTGWSLRVPGKSMVQRVASLSNAIRGKSVRDAIHLLARQAEEGGPEEEDIARYFSEFMLRGLGDDCLLP